MQPSNVYRSVSRQSSHVSTVSNVPSSPDCEDGIGAVGYKADASLPLANGDADPAAERKDVGAPTFANQFVHFHHPGGFRPVVQPNLHVVPPVC